MADSLCPGVLVWEETGTQRRSQGEIHAGDGDQDRRAGQTYRLTVEPTVRAVCWHCPRPNPGQKQGRGRGRGARETEDKRQLSEHLMPTTEAGTSPRTLPTPPQVPPPAPSGHSDGPTAPPGLGRGQFCPSRRLLLQGSGFLLLGTKSGHPGCWSEFNLST